VLEIQNLRKSFGSRIAVNGISFAIKKGETVGLLGPNGAGKTTAIAMICGITPPDSGDILLNNELITARSKAIKRHVGLVPQDLALYDELSAWANLQLFGGLYGITDSLLRQRADHALQLVGLADRKHEHVKNFSGGMKRRLNIAGALLHDPDLILLDEPTVGIDPQSRNAIFDNIETLKRQGKTLLYTTHYMEEAERLCDRILIMDHGQVIANGSIAELYAKLPVQHQAIIDLPDDTPNDQLLNELSTRFGSRFRVQQRGAKLEDVFMQLTGRALRDSNDTATGESA
jgi:ABC-2 type transport system ATP-binding protein